MGALDDGEKVVAADAATWRAWLGANHATSKGAWLVRPRPGSNLELIGYEDAIMQALCFGWIDGPVRTFDEQTGGLWFAPRRPASGWAATAPVAGSGPSALGPVASGFVTMNFEPPPMRRIALVMASNE